MKFTNSVANNSCNTKIQTTQFTNNPLSQANVPLLSFSLQPSTDQEVQVPSSPPPTIQPTSPVRSFPLFPNPLFRSTPSLVSPINISFTTTRTPSYESSPRLNSSTLSEYLSSQTNTTMNSEDLGGEREQRRNDRLRFLQDEGYSMAEEHRLAEDIFRRNNRQQINSLPNEAANQAIVLSNIPNFSDSPSIQFNNWIRHFESVIDFANWSIARSSATTLFKANKHDSRVHRRF